MGDIVNWSLASIPLTCVGLVVLATWIPGLDDKIPKLFKNYPRVRKGWHVMLIISVLAICTLLVGHGLTSDSRNSTPIEFYDGYPGLPGP